MSYEKELSRQAKQRSVDKALVRHRCAIEDLKARVGALEAPAQEAPAPQDPAPQAVWSHAVRRLSDTVTLPLCLHEELTARLNYGKKYLLTVTEIPDKDGAP